MRVIAGWSGIFVEVGQEVFERRNVHRQGGNQRFALGGLGQGLQLMLSIVGGHWNLTLELSGRCHSERQVTVARRSGPLDRIVSCRFGRARQLNTSTRLEHALAR